MGGGDHRVVAMVLVGICFGELAQLKSEIL
jgi:hypothetical protein